MRKTQIESSFFLWTAAALLLLPIKWVAAGCFAAAFHELCHYWVTRFLGGQILSISLHASGARMQTSPLSPGKQLLAILAGPAGGFLLASLIHWFTLCGLCGLIHSIYNLLPIRSLDGGRALRCGAELFLPKKTADCICRASEILCIVLLTAAGAYAALVLPLGLFPLMIPPLICFRAFSGKIPCKTRLQRVQ